MNKYIRLFDTIKYLKLKQIYFRLFYFVRNRYRKIVGFKYPAVKNIEINKLTFQKSISSYHAYNEKNEFIFLNLSKKFENNIDWNYSCFGKLWTYNLNYFEFLNQKDINLNEAIGLIHDFVKKESILKDAIEPFPISLRGVNWIKFLSNNSIEDTNINEILYKHYNILLDNLEYHLLGNHLLENGFSLLFGAYYFEDENFYNKAKEILKEELKEQILNDGAHFELSPMYHQIMLVRVLDCINLVQNNIYKNQELLGLLKEKASVMLGWLKNISFKNGEIPLMNDSANKIAPSSTDLFEYALKLNLEVVVKMLNQSGYRKVEKDSYECIVDIGEVGASYIPGHAHADTFNFELYIKNKPFIVDTGLSTYNTGKLRDSQRSTKAHNTVEINSQNSSEVWGGFRVADRANIVEVIKEDNYIKATHDGYKKKFNIFHTRSWNFEENKIVIEDSLNKNSEAVARLHFHPDIDEKEIKSKINLDNLKYKIEKYNYAPEFNKTFEALTLEIFFKKELKVEINI